MNKRCAGRKDILCLHPLHKSPNNVQSFVAAQPGLCRTRSETLKTGFLASRLKLSRQKTEKAQIRLHGFIVRVVPLLFLCGKPGFLIFSEVVITLVFKQRYLYTAQSFIRIPGPEVIKLFSCSTQLSLKFILLINVKMPTIVGILTFISRINGWL